jgi:hypothetical protein
MKEASELGVMEAAKRHLPSDILEEVMKGATTKGTVGMTAASGAQWSGLSSGGIYAEQEEKNPLMALGFGTAAGMIEPLPQVAALMKSGLGGKILNTATKSDVITGPIDLLKKTGIAAASNMPKEGLQEVVQTGLEQKGAGKDPFSEESQREQILAGIAGAGIGAGFGGGAKFVSGSIDMFKQGKPVQDQTTPVDLTGEERDNLTFEEEVALRFPEGGIEPVLGEEAYPTIPQAEETLLGGKNLPVEGLEPSVNLSREIAGFNMAKTKLYEKHLGNVRNDLGIGEIKILGRIYK